MREHENGGSLATLAVLAFDNLINGLQEAMLVTERHREIGETAILILRELQKEGIDDLDGVRDLISDYNAQAKTYQAMHKKYEVARKPIRKDGVLHCPECNHRVGPNHSHCHWCGQKLGY